MNEGNLLALLIVVFFIRQSRLHDGGAGTLIALNMIPMASEDRHLSLYAISLAESSLRCQADPSSIIVAVVVRCSYAQ